ncbi:MAG: DUF4097 family beta strand repeat protein [Acidobacteria bacterium]|nr:DUF4097 family beta strand repeat protein [Acidobacteriota bacterium]
MRRIAVFAALALAAVSASAAQQHVNRSFNVPAGGKLVLRADVGDVKVVTGSGALTVDVMATGSDEDLRELSVQFKQDGDTLFVDGKSEEHSGWRWFNSNDLRVKFVVTVPRRLNVDLSTSGGDVDLADLDGEVNARTSGGDIEIGNTTGNVIAKTSGGDVKVRGSNGSVKVGSSGGDITIDQANGIIEARTSGGDVEIRRAGANVFARSSGGGIRIDDAYGAVDASTSGGSIQARFSRQPTGDSRLVTSGGGISVTLPANIAADLDAHTSGGDIDSSIPVQVLGKQSEDSLVGKVNGGGPKLYVRTSGGGITFKRM